MKEFKEVGMKVADNSKEAMIENVKKQIEQKIRDTEFGIEIDKVILAYLQTKKK